MSKGRLIVIDGTDGSGKATQTKLLIKRLQKEGYKVRTEDFPQYSKKSAGPVEEYLNGIYGTSDELGAYIPSVFFAVDRYAASKRIRDYLKKGYVIVSNRYVTANMAHQGGKIKDLQAREKYLNWVTEFEYKFFNIPKPDLQIILHIPPEVSVKLIKLRGKQYYIGKKKKDIHESDLKHLRSAEKVYLQIAKKFKYKVIEGFVDGRLLTPEEVNNKIYPIVHGYLRNRN
jgi:dTMP kinase